MVPYNTFNKFICCCIILSFSYPQENEKEIRLNTKTTQNEVGVLSINHIDGSLFEMQIYVISDEPVTGLQFGISPRDMFEVLGVYGGESENKEFTLHHNETGTILAFSMSGAVIPPSSSSKPKDNVAIKVKLKQRRDYKKGEAIKLNSILAAKGGTRITANDRDYDLNNLKIKK